MKSGLLMCLYCTVCQAASKSNQLFAEVVQVFFVFCFKETRLHQENIDETPIKYISNFEWKEVKYSGGDIKN